MNNQYTYNLNGVDLLETLPQGWEFVKLKYLSNDPLMYGANESAELEDRDLPRYIRITDLDSQGNLKDDTFRSLPFDKANNYMLKNGDILFARSGATVGKAYIHKDDLEACFAGYLIRYRANQNKINPKLIYYYTQTVFYADLIRENTIQATIQNVSAEKYANLSMPVPPIQEQDNIVCFLDDKISEIDSLIADKENLIELLEENRQVKIVEFITKGLKPNAKMKDSNVGWIDKIPEHWEEKKIKYLFYEVNERNFEEDAELLSVFTSIGVRPRSQMEDRGNKAQTVMNYKKVKKGDIVVNKLLAWMGAIGISDYEGVTSPDYDVYRQINENLISNKYYHYYFRSHYFKGDCYKFGRGIMMMRWRTYPEQFKSIPVPVPPIEEQIEIANYIDEKTKDIDLLITETKSAISKLREYRQSLIYEAVTGKIDVRNYEKLST